MLRDEEQRILSPGKDLSAESTLHVDSEQQRGKNYYKEQIRNPATDTLLVNTMVRICQSLANKDLEKVLSDYKLRDDLLELDRHQKPGMVPGLEAVLSLVRDSVDLEPNSAGTRDVGRIVDLTLGGVEALYLTLTTVGIEVVDLT